MTEHTLQAQLNSNYWIRYINKCIKKDGCCDVFLIKDHGLKMSLFPKEESK